MRQTHIKSKALSIALAFLIAVTMTPCWAIMTASEASAEAMPNCTGGCNHVAQIGDTHYNTLAEAVEAATEGQVVKLLKDCTENIEKTITAAITIDGDKKTMSGKLKLDGNGSNNLTVKNFKFETNGLDISGFEDVTVTGNEFTNITSENRYHFYDAIAVAESKNATVTNNVVNGANEVGINCRNISTMVTITDNIVKNTNHNSVQIVYSGSEIRPQATVTANSFENWGEAPVPGKTELVSGRALRAQVNGLTFTGNVMKNNNAPEEFVKLGGSTGSIDASQNYWNGGNPSGNIQETTTAYFIGLSDDNKSELKSYYSDEAKTTLVTFPAEEEGIKTEEELEAALMTGGEIKLANDIALSKALTIPSGKSVILNLNGKTLSNSNDGVLVLTGNTLPGQDNKPGNPHDCLTLTGNGTISAKKNAIMLTTGGDYKSADLTLAGVTITTSAGDAVYQRSMYSVITLEDGTTNTITAGGASSAGIYASNTYNYIVQMEIVGNGTLYTSGDYGFYMDACFYPTITASNVYAKGVKAGYKSNQIYYGDRVQSGYYSNLMTDYCASGYASYSNTNEATKADYPYYVAETADVLLIKGTEISGYSTIQEAVDVANNVPSEIRLNNNVNGNVNIEVNQTITLEGEDYLMTGTITNNGSLKVMSGSYSQSISSEWLGYALTTKEQDGVYTVVGDLPYEGGVYHIATEKDFVALQYIVNRDVNDFKGEKVVLDADIDMSKLPEGYRNWTPIGTDKNYFSGTFDGCNHTISNLTIDGYEYVALFSFATGTFENLTMEKCKIESDYEAAVLIAQVTDSNLVMRNISFKNCNVKGGGSYSGICTAYCLANESLFENITVDSNSSVNGYGIGSLAGYVQAETSFIAKKCINNAPLTVQRYGGGMVSQTDAYTTDLVFENCTNNAEMTCTTPSEAIIYLGGFIGYRAPNAVTTTVFTNCKNTGNIVGDSSTSGNRRFGGFIGYTAGNPCVFTNCVNSGTVSGRNAGGFVGLFNNNVETRFVSCTSSGNVNSTTKAGYFISESAQNKMWASKPVMTGTLIHSSGTITISGETEDTRKYVARLGNPINGTYYTTLAAAVEAANKELSNIYLLADSEENITITKALSIETGTATKDSGCYTMQNVSKGAMSETVTGTLHIYEPTSSVAQIGETKYETLAEAINEVQNNETIKILCDIPDATGLKIDTNKNFTIDFNNYTYTVTAPAAGSTGTKNQAFQIIKGQTITMKNGTVKIGASNLTSESGKISRVIQNYANLTLDNMKFDDENLAWRSDSQTASGTLTSDTMIECDNGTVNLRNGTTLTIAEANKSSRYALGIEDWNSSYPNGAQLTVDNATINGHIRFYSDWATGSDLDSTLAIQTNTLNGKIYDEVKGVTGGKITENIDGYDLVLVEKTEKAEVYVIDKKPVAKIGNTTYASLKDAVAAVPAGTPTTITMIADETFADNDTVTIPADKNIILDLNGKIITGKNLNVSTWAFITNNGILKIKDSLTGGKITSSTTPDTDGFAGHYTVLNKNQLTLESGTIEKTSDKVGGNKNLKWALRNEASENQTVTLNITGGQVVGEYNAVSNYVYNDTSTCNVNISGGKIITNGRFSAMTMQIASGNKPNFNVKITDGEFITKNIRNESEKGNATIYCDDQSSSVTDCNKIEIDIAGGRFDTFNTNMIVQFDDFKTETTKPTEYISGGYFSNVPAVGEIVSGKQTRDTTDEEKAKYGQKYRYALGPAEYIIQTTSAVKNTSSGIIEPKSVAPISGGGVYHSGDTANLYAPELENFEFVGWYTKSGNNYNAIEGATKQEYKIGSVSESKVYVAVYSALSSKKVNISAEPIGGGTVSETQSLVDPGETVTITAIPNSGKKFVYWINKSGKAISASDTYEVTAVENVEVTAVFSDTGSTTVFFEDDSENLLSAALYTAETATQVAKVTAPSKMGTEFEGWTATKEFTIPEGKTYSAGQALSDEDVAAIVKATAELDEGQRTLTVKANYKQVGQYTIKVYALINGELNEAPFATITKNVGTPSLITISKTSVNNNVPLAGVYQLGAAPTSITAAPTTGLVSTSGEFAVNPQDGTYYYLAVYTNGTTTSDKIATLTVNPMSASFTNSEKIDLTLAWHLPEGATLVDAGFYCNVDSDKVTSHSCTPIRTSLSSASGSTSVHIDAAGHQNTVVYAQAFLKYRYNEREITVYSGQGGTVSVDVTTVTGDATFGTYLQGSYNSLMKKEGE